ncbi:hypothetical protein A2773_02275 [Candidatus Gottesmanbacteria bacterium RIFCSPHIGHO2_01_FULL_39_10]|uniref:ChrB C-terminal domain-containing protein n=1 Tax=Candidatus Gottesmanbacteria bacterium RIFCSPHIGHO2_01_FULL_39_10 TaxID=1798375 RepID=A0A1F5ZQB3_9BACT|nr:MAG: hypothetical protein A2773_02275 [Candidatus Gottesmanbacteria bacterium RIFCSPHIGHO2_01_FULL_39_10]
MKTIVTHHMPDLDAISSVWLLKRFMPGWDKAQVAFVPAGSTLGEDVVDSDPSILHVDTGLGQLDHHQTDEDTCAAKRTLEYIVDYELRTKNQKLKDEALERLVEIVNDIDHFRDAYYPNPAADFYDFSLVGQLDGWKLLFPDDNQKLVDLGMVALDGIYKKLQDKVWASREIEEKGVDFTTKWGKALGIETVNDEVVRLGQKMGYVLVVRKDPNKDYARIKALPNSKADLESAYKKLKKLDASATWYLHVSHKMLLNGSMKNPKTKPTKLTLREIIDVLKI